MSFSV